MSYVVGLQTPLVITSNTPHREVGVRGVRLLSCCVPKRDGERKAGIERGGGSKCESQGACTDLNEQTAGPFLRKLLP